MLPEADYEITVTLSPAQHGWEIVRVEAGDTANRLFGAALDIGTNGELAFGCKDYLLLGAGAAGPALEGAVSEYGMRAKPGAVSSVTIDKNGDLHYETIGGMPPIGICDSGIMDLIAQGFLAGWISGYGSLNVDRSDRIRWVWSKLEGRTLPAIMYAPDLYFTEADIKEWIKCKAAAFTMVATLLDHCGLSKDDIGQLYLAGGFGTHYNLESAITTGLYPDLPRERFQILGNSSLKGAMKLLLDRDQIKRLQHFQNHGVYLQFGEMERFLENMIAAEFLPHTDRTLYPSVGT